jgi:uncharacterized protein
MQQLMKRHRLFSFDPRKVATFCQQRAFELRVWATHTTPASSLDDKWRLALSLSRGDMRNEDIGVGSRTMMAQPCRGSREAMKTGDGIELDLAKTPHIPALLSFAKRHGPKRVLPQLEAVATEGNAKACYRLYKHYRNKNQGSEGLKKMRWLKAAADGGHADAQFRLAGFYERGEGVTQDLGEAVRYYRLAADQGDDDAQFSLAVCYEHGEGVAQSNEEAVRYYRLAAEQGHADAQNNLGVCYEHGDGVAQSSEEAVRCYRLAADQGHAKAQYNLAVCYKKGQGVERNTEQAARYYRLAADQGDAEAQFNLGVCYDSGEGVEPDEAEAARYYRLAADRGYAFAQYGLGWC